MNNIDIFKEYLITHKYSVTEERLKLAHIVADFKNHQFSIDDIYSALKNTKFQIARSTIYRNIKLLRAARIIAPVSDNSSCTEFVNTTPSKLTCKLQCIESGFEKKISDVKLEDAIMQLCHKYKFEEFGVNVIIESRLKR